MPFENSVGHGGLLTTVADLLRWQRRFLAPAALVDTAIGGRNFVRDMEEQVTLTTGRRSGYALGLEIDTMSGERVVTHGGWTAGYKAYVGRVPAQGVGVALLCNAGSLNTEEVGAAVLAVASGLAIPNLYVEPRLGAPADSADPRSLARLAGSYRSERTRQPVRVRAYADGLTINSWTGYRRGADSTFVSLDGTRTIRFLHDARGTPMGYRVNQGADTVRYARVSAWTPSATELRSAVGRFRCTEADADVEIIADAAGLSFRRRGRLLNALRPRYRDAFDMPDLGWLLNIRRSPAPADRIRPGRSRESQQRPESEGEAITLHRPSHCTEHRWRSRSGRSRILVLADLLSSAQRRVRRELAAVTASRWPERLLMAQHVIECRPDVMMGKPVFKGTRIPVELVLRKLGEGATEADLLEAYPRLTREHLQAAVLYAADVVRGDEVVYFEPEGARLVEDPR